jgi:lysophospholipase L1-like esterase
MRKNTPSLFQGSFVGLTAACFLSIAAHATPLSVHKVAPPPALVPLQFSIGGRMSTTPSKPANSFGSKDYTSQWPGSYFRAAFHGTMVFFRIGKSDEILHIMADGQLAATLVKPTPGVYELEGLPNADHTAGVFVATESHASPNTFGGFAIPSGEKPLTLPTRHRQIEFIGDSHTVGYGDLSPKHQCTQQQVWADTDDTKAFGPLTARHYDADYQVNAISGRGVVRNYNGSQWDTLLQAYPYVLFNKKQKYKDPSWRPQVFVIALGTNDFSTPLNRWEHWKSRAALHADYEVTYLHFLKKLRAAHPHAFFIVWATDVFQGEVETETQKVVQEREAQGDKNIVYLPVNGLIFGACNSHPTLADEKTISDKLVHRIDAHKDVWQSH